MEASFGHDLAGVRVHTDAQAAESARAVRAQAYTVGQHVVFGEDRFAPGTHAGRELLAHELAHTIQQRGAAGAPPGHDVHSIHETTARTASRSIAHGQPLQQELPAAGVGLSRAPVDDDERGKAVAEALAYLASVEKEEKEDEEQEAAERSKPEPSIRPTTLSLLNDDARFKATLVTDEEIYARLKEPTPEEPEYWAAQVPGSLEKPIKIGSATKYVRRWETITIEMPGDQADRHEDVEISHWTMTRPALRGYLQYMVGDLTPFEESLVQGGVPMPEGFTPVAAGSAIGYYIQSGESGRRDHIIYNRDGTTFRSWTSEAALVNMGIGPLVLALPGIGLRGMARSAATVGRTGINIAGRIATRAGARLRPLAITAKLAIGSAEAGAVGAAPTAFGGIASRTTVTLVDAKPLASIVEKIAPAASEVAAETTAVQSIPSTTPTAVAATEEAASVGAARPGSVPPVSIAQESPGAYESGGVPGPDPKAHLQNPFRELGGPKQGFQIQIVDDSTVIEKPRSLSNIGLSTRNVGGAQTDPVSKQIWIHQAVIDENGVVRKWGATLDLKQVIAHELGHGLNKGGPCSMASRTAADLPGLSAAQRTGLLDDAVHISRASSMAVERVSLDALRLPKGYKPPKP
jgi:hypothetical protein